MLLRQRHAGRFPHLTKTSGHFGLDGRKHTPPVVKPDLLLSLNAPRWLSTSNKAGM